MEITLASLCSRASSAVAMLQTRAARTPRTLLAAICSPFPDPPNTTPSVSIRGLIAHDGLGGTDAERGIVVQRVVLDRPVVHDVVALPREVVLQLRGELETRMIGGDVDAHAPILGARVPCGGARRDDMMALSCHSLRASALYEVKANLFKGLAHPLRIRLLELLAGAEEVRVADLQSETGLEASHLSQHLSVLRRHRLVESERRASHVYYRLADPASRTC
jgi:DNA-binding transcriptional ArsR family regulator